MIAAIAALLALRLRATLMLLEALYPEPPLPKGEIFRKAVAKAHADHGKCPPGIRCPWPACTPGTHLIVNELVGSVNSYRYVDRVYVRKALVRSWDGDPSTARPEYRWALSEAKP